MVRNFLRTALRNLWKNKTYSLLNILGLSVGITCAALIFLWVEDELTYNHQNIKKDVVYQLMENQAYDNKTYTFAATPGPLAPALKDEIPGIKNTFRATWRQNVLFSLGEKSIYEKGNFSDSSIFSILTIPFISGNKEKVFSLPNSIAISESMAKIFFGSTDVIGKTLKIDNKREGIISAVFKDIPENSTYKFEWLQPFQLYLDKNDWLKDWGNNGIMTFAEIEKNADAVQINNKVFAFIQSKDTSANAHLFLLPMKDWRLRNNFVDGKQSGGQIQYVNLFTTIAWIILLIACINFMNLATARSEKRAREVGVRKVLGAAKNMLVLQFIGEALLMSFLAVIVAIGIISVLLPSFNSLVEKHLYLGLNNPVHNSALLAIALICGLIAGSYPSFYLSSFNPTSVLKGLVTRSGSAAMIRKGLVVVQFSVSIILIISTMVIYQQIHHIKNRELGYNKNNLVEIAGQGDMTDHFDAVKADMLRTGAVENACLSNLDMLEMGSSSNNFTWKGKNPDQKVLITICQTSPEFIPTTGIKLIRGRLFRNPYKSDTSNIIINETLAKMIGNDPVGQIISQDTVKFQVIGVVKDFVFGDMYGKSDPLIFECRIQKGSNMYVRLAKGYSTEKGIAEIEKVYKNYTPAYPFEYHFVDERFDALFKSETLVGKLSGIFAALAIFISCLGLFGLSAYTAERRTKEIGIRKVLGASITGITTQLSTDFVKLVLYSLVISFPVAWWMMRKWLQDYAYRIHINAMVFLVAGLAAIFIALLTISFQSIRAAISNPSKSLRTE